MQTRFLLMSETPNICSKYAKVGHTRQPRVCMPERNQKATEQRSKTRKKEQRIHKETSQPNRTRNATKNQMIPTFENHTDKGSQQTNQRSPKDQDQVPGEAGRDQQLPVFQLRPGFKRLPTQSPKRFLGPPVERIE